MKVYYSEQPDRIAYYPQENGTAEVYLRKNIKEEELEDSIIWTADEVFLKTRLSEEEVEEQFDSYFVEQIEATIDDLVDAIEVLANIIMEG